RDSSDGGGISKVLYQFVAEKVAKEWNYNNNCGLVVGATYPGELKIVRRIVGEIPILIPGVGAQGGDTEKTVKAGIDKDGMNAIINSSRGIIFASNGPDFAKKAREEAVKLRDEINKYRS
ncbi:MAG: orotidine 5'-phosphate decarboxylase, partial [uncultured bacterium]